MCDLTATAMSLAEDEPFLAPDCTTFKSSPCRHLDSRGESALRLAMSKRNVEVVDLLVNHPNIRLKDGGWMAVRCSIAKS